MNALVIASTSRDDASKHVLKNDIAWLHSPAIVAHTCARLMSPGVVVCEMMTTTTDAKQSIARSICRARVKSKHSAIIVSESAVHVLLLCVRRNHRMGLWHTVLGKRHSSACLFPSKKQAAKMTVTWRPVYVMMAPSTGGEFKASVHLPTDVKTVSAIKLNGYILMGMGTAGHVALDVLELSTNNNTTLCNIEGASNYYYICYHRPQSTAATAEYVHRPDGVTCQYFNARNMNTLTLALRSISTSPNSSGAIGTSTAGEAYAQFWLELLVECA